MPTRPVYGEILFVLKLNPYLSYKCLEKLCLLVQGQAVEILHADTLHCLPELWYLQLGLHRNSSVLWQSCHKPM